MKLKFKILFIMLLISQSSYACERVVNEEFNFSYIYSKEKNTFSYKIERKDGKIFPYYKKYVYDFPIEIGVIVLGKQNQKDRVDTEYGKYMSNENNYSFSQHTGGNSRRNFTLTEEDFVKTDKISNTLELNQLFSLLRNSNGIDIFSGNKKIMFTVRTPLGSELKECISFKAQALEYDFSSKYYWTFKRQFINIFYWN